MEVNKMKKLLSVFVAMLLFLSVPVMAQEPAVPELPEPGTTPDSALYFLDLALDNLALALTFDSDARIEKELEIAEERLAEVRTMALEGEFEAMTKAEGEHGKVFAELKEEVKEVENGDSEVELKKELEIERKIKRHSEKVEDVEKELKVKIEIKGEITPEQQALIDSILASLEGQTGEVEIEIENEKGKTKIKIEQETGRSGDEVEYELKVELGIDKEEQEEALEEMTEVREELEELTSEASAAGVALPSDLIGQINNLLDQAQEAFAAGNFEQAEELAEVADDLLEDLEDAVEDLIEENEAEDEETKEDDDEEDNEAASSGSSDDDSDNDISGSDSGNDDNSGSGSSNGGSGSDSDDEE